MNLTEKCKEKFIFWMCENYEYVRWHEYEDMPECALNALIIEWLDSVGIHISIYRDFFFNDWYFKILGHCEKSHFKSRIKATNAAIEKANSIYNKTPA